MNNLSLADATTVERPVFLLSLLPAIAEAAIYALLIGTLFGFKEAWHFFRALPIEVQTFIWVIVIADYACSFLSCYAYQSTINLEHGSVQFANSDWTSFSSGGLGSSNRSLSTRPLWNGLRCFHATHLRSCTS